MNWEVPVAMILVLTLAVEAILTLRPMVDPVSSQLDEGGAAKQAVEVTASE